ncbi:unnamed protein product, partial [Lymnaea stagnalis]
QGCFAYKGKLKTAKDEDYITSKNEKLMKNRLRIYKQLWEDVHTRIDIFRSDLNAHIFEDLLLFAKSCHRDRDLLDKVTISEIPTAVLITGVNTPDHEVMFSNLGNMLKLNVTPLVARIFTRDSSRITTLIRSIVLQLTNVSGFGDDDTDREDSICIGDDNFEKMTTLKKNKAVTMTTLVKWYERKYLCKRKKSSKLTNAGGMEKDETIKKPLIVIMLEEAECMNPNVLQDFITLCSSYLFALPIVLVLGIATAITTVHQLLPMSVSSLLCMEKFHAPPASQYLSQLLDKITMNTNIPFRLGPKVFNFLLDMFLYHDFSIMNFIMGYQYSMMEHFLSNPLSILCSPSEDIDSTLSQLTHAQLEDLRRHSNFMRCQYCFNTYYTGDFMQHYQIKCMWYEPHWISVPDQVKLLTDDQGTKMKLAEELKMMHTFHITMFPSMRFLHCLGQNLPKHPLGKQIRELYSVILAGDVLESEGYKQTFSLLRIMCSDDLHELLGLCLSTIADNKDVEILRRLFEDVERYRYRLTHLEEEIENEEPSGQKENTVKILPLRAKLHELKEKLQSMSSSRKKSPYEKLREEILNCLDNYFRQLLICPMSFPFSDVLYFNDLSAIRDQIKAVPRCSIQCALTQPGKYMMCPCCQCDKESILQTMPDICIVYKLHLECGTLVNLYDWLQAFIVIVTSNMEGKKTKMPLKIRSPSTELKARFIRAVSELQFLGFIKATQRKTDHVTRLTW